MDPEKKRRLYEKGWVATTPEKWLGLNGKGKIYTFIGTPKSILLEVTSILIAVWLSGIHFGKGHKWRGLSNLLIASLRSMRVLKKFRSIYN